MASEISKPDFSFQWASGGAIVAPSDVKIQTGWTAEVPPFQWENFAQNRQDNAILYLFQKGISEWDAASNYYFATSGVRSYVQGSDGNIYVAVQDSVGQNPTTDTADAYWTLALVTPQNKGFSLLTSRTTAGTSNFTVPANIYKLFYRIWGGGAGGGGGSSGAFAGNGGGAGSYSEGWLAVTPGQVISATVGAGGAAGGVGLVGGNGTSSSFSTITCPGGAGGAGGGTGGGAGGSIPTGGDFSVAGGSGTGTSLFNPAGTLYYGPPGGLSYGVGALVAGYASGVGTGGKFPGGGGGGGNGGSSGANVGGAGSQGAIFIWG